MFNDRYKEKVTIKIPSSTIDGVTAYEEYVGHAIVTENTTTQVESGRKVILSRTFWVKTRCEPVPGSVIVYKDESHYLKNVRSCRHITGELECYRCHS